MNNIDQNENYLSENSSYSYFNIYNNEIIGCIGIYSVIRELEYISSAKAMLILPLILQNDLLKYVNHSRVNIKSIEQLIIRKPDLLANVSVRFYSLIEITINSILILSSLEFITIDAKGIIRIVKDKDFLPIKDKKTIGNRGLEIIKGSRKIAELLGDSVENLYLQLRVRL